ncbi:MAG TPA: hypothetical protein VMJ75_13470 [Candidatus Acidoferrales bacterium]|nr:hypothetical protein [Candidatus Acidoferrales bacterium]
MNLNSAEIDRLAIAVEEAARAASVAKPRFVEPARGTLDRAKAKRHQIVFGRRGSGKTSLLAKAAADLTVDRRAIAFVNLETFKGHSYPDVLLSVLIDSLSKFKDWLETAATNPASKTTFWRRLFGTTPKRPPLDRKKVGELAAEIEELIADLQTQLYAEDAAALKEITEHALESTDAAEANAGLKAGPASVGAKASTKEVAKQRSQVTEESRRSKIDFLHRHIIEYQRLLKRIAEVAGGDAYLFLDDLYHIRKNDQPSLLDYFHRIAKGNDLWLKAGTIRHRTEWYKHSDPPIGVKLGDDAEEIDLDLTLEKYATAKRFLGSVLQGIADEVEFGPVDNILARTAMDRLVLACGGVARDFLALFRRSLDVARERGGGPGGDRISVPDVNQAAGEYEASKRDELKRDTLEERQDVESAFEAVKTFCLERANANCFLLEKDRTDAGARLIEELVDLRLLHLVQSRVTVRDRPGKLYVAYMLDLGQYTGERKRRAWRWWSSGSTRDGNAFAGQNWCTILARHHRTVAFCLTNDSPIGVITERPIASVRAPTPLPHYIVIHMGRSASQPHQAARQARNAGYLSERFPCSDPRSTRR